jgi:hypothetical protein
MVLVLWCYCEEEGWQLASSEIASANWIIPVEAYSVECFSAEDWGCPNGGLVPVNEEGEMITHFGYGDGDFIYQVV